MNKFKDFVKSFLIWFFVFYAILAGYEYFWGKKNQPAPQEKEEILVQPVKNSVVIGNPVQWKITNHLTDEIVFPSPCETPGALTLSRIANDQNFDISSPILQDCPPESVPTFRLQPGSSTYFSLENFNHELFTEAGKYGLEMKFSVKENTVDVTSPEIEIEAPGALRRLFRTIVSKPLFNLLVFLADTLPGHPLGWSIVIMTLLVRLALFIPNQKAMRSQREMQKLQPKMEEIKQQHGKNQQMVAMKTMELYKTHKISPFSSCLPMLLQMPFLIGVYYIIRDGLSPSLGYLLYSFQQGVDLTVINNNFFGLDLSQIPRPDFSDFSTYTLLILPIIVGVTQWGAVKLSLISAKKKQAKNTDNKSAAPNQMQQMNTIMLWVMPVMIGFFTTSFPAGVGIYWLTSTIFGIFQQKYVNWQLDQPQVTRKES